VQSRVSPRFILLPLSLAKREGDTGSKGFWDRFMQDITGQASRGYRSPSWELSEHSLGLLDDAPNLVYAPVANRLGPMRNAEEV